MSHADNPMGTIGSSIARTTFDTRAAFTDHLQDALGRAQREVWMTDRDFSDWPISTAPFTAALQGFLRMSAANRLRMLTLDPDRIAIAAPRFIEILRPHSIGAQCRLVPPHAAARFGEACSMMIVDRTLLVRRFHRDHLRGAVEFDPAAARPWLDQFEMLWEESSPALASTKLGLG
jgi:hypothetical protein